MKYEISKSLIKLDELEYIIREINYGELNKTWVNSIENAWIKGAFLDKRGIVWIKYQYLPKLARIKKELVNYYLALIGLPISDYISGTDFVNLLSVVFNATPTFRKRDYIRYSEKLYCFIRDSNKAEVLRARYYENIEDQRKKLKKRRIKKYNITVDELTRKPLNLKTAEFSHIRSVAIYPDLQLEEDNGLIINKETHDIITKNNIQNEEDLVRLCVQKRWETGWFVYYKKIIEKDLENI